MTGLISSKYVEMINFAELIFNYFSANDLKTILIIDDEEKLRSLLAKIISLEGVDVHQPILGFYSVAKQVKKYQI
jgi:hypothetical protein